MAASSTPYSAVYLVPRGGASVGSNLDDKVEESFPLLAKRKNSDSTSRLSSSVNNREKMADNKTPGLNESVQDFKAKENRDPEGLNSDVRVSFLCRKNLKAAFNLHGFPNLFSM